MKSATQRVLVTGAGSGIGRAICEQLAAAGDVVIGTVRDAQRARDLEREALGRIRYLPLQLENDDTIHALVEEIAGAGPLDVLVHNAGYGVFGPVETVDAASAARQFAVNLFGPLTLTRGLLPGLRSRRGRILWIGSLGGRFALPFQAHYCASKAAIAALSDAMRMELRPFGVAVTCVEPGDFNTGFTVARRWHRDDHECPYRDALERGHRAVVKSEQTAPRPDRAAAQIARLTRKSNPPARVVVGEWARTLCLLERLLPVRLKEAVLRWRYDV